MVFGEKTGEFSGFGQFEIGEIETRRHGAAYEGEICLRRRLAGEPTSGGHHILKGFSGIHVVAQSCCFQGPVGMNNMNQQCFSRIKMPAFITFYTVKSGEVSPWKQEINRGGKTPGSRKPFGKMFLPYVFPAFISFNIETTLRVRQQVKPGYELFSIVHASKYIILHFCTPAKALLFLLPVVS